ncbi:MAG: ribulose-phosphate 3-epimerase [Nanoarchaeota archaeon]
MTTIIPTVFAHNTEEFSVRFERLIGISNKLQIDFMDGRFVEAKSIELKEIPNLKKYKNKFEAHLMVSNPVGWIEECRKKGFVKIIFHYEAISEEEIANLVERIRERKMKAFMAINPETRVEEIVDLIKSVDGILVMGVHPGKEGQELDFNIFARIREIRKKNKKIDIQVDGGVKADNIGKLAKAGANLINTGSFVSKAENPKNALGILRNLVK